MARALISIIFVYITAVVTVACSNPKGEFFYGALGLGEARIAVATANPLALTVLLYDLDGQLVDVIADYTAPNNTPRGIAPFDAFNIAVLLDGVDRIARLSLTGAPATDVVTNANLTGTLYQLAHDEATDRYYAIEGNTIEAFERVGGARVGNPYIAAALGSCTLAVSRGIAATGDGRLFVVGTTNDDLNMYTVTGSTAACTTANTAFGNVDPVGVMVHSNGLVYVSTLLDDRVYSFNNDGTGAGTVVWDTDVTVINNPTALLELPDGTILVASDGTNTIERIDTSGNVVGSTSFIRDAFSGLVTQMLLIGGE